MTDLAVHYANAATAISVTPAIFTNNAGISADPGTVTCIVTDPSGTATTYTYAAGSGYNQIVKVAIGDYTLTLTGLTLGGIYTVTWVGSGNNVQQVFASTFRLIPLTDVGSGMNMWYCTMEELKSRLQIDQSDTDDDYEIQLAIQAVTDWITKYCGRHFYRVNETRTYRPDNVWDLLIDDLVSCTSLDLDYDGDGVYEVHWVEGRDFQLLRYMSDYNAHDLGVSQPSNQVQVLANSSGGSTTGGQWFPWLVPFMRQNRVSIQGVWGWEAIPPGVTMAALYLAAEMFKSKDSPFGVAGISDLGLVKIQASPWVVELLRPYKNVRKTVGV